MLAVEVGVIIVWAMWVGRAYLDFNPFTWPDGPSAGGRNVGHYFWVNLKQCGLCALWNGSLEGGAPALADRFSSFLNPLVIVPTLLWGVMIGTKISLVGALAVAGLAQWWIARTLRLGWVARMWSALIAVAGGHLAQQIVSDSNFQIIISTAFDSLAVAAGLSLGINRRRRDAIILALCGAWALLSGGGYMQFALLITAPAFLFFVLDKQFHFRRLWREYVLAVGVCLLLVGVWLVPVIHFAPHSIKDSSDPQFSSAEPLEYTPLHFILKETQGGIDPRYVGALPILLAFLCLKFARREDYAALACLASILGLLFFFASGIPMRWLAPYAPSLYGFRYIGFVEVLAPTGILGLAAYSLDALLRVSWPRLGLYLPQNPLGRLSFDTRWILVIGLFPTVQTVYAVNQPALQIRDESGLYTSALMFRTPTLEWQDLPLSLADWVEPMVYSGIKVAHFLPEMVGWGGRTAPYAYMYLSDGGDQPPGAKPTGMTMNDTPIYVNPGNEYAAVVFEDGTQTPCAAVGAGGDLSVECTTDHAGRLVVQENSSSDWYAWRDGAPAKLNPAPADSYWLSTEAPPGQHVYLFAYRPWDAWVGLLATLAGLALMARLWFRASEQAID